MEISSYCILIALAHKTTNQEIIWYYFTNFDTIHTAISYGSLIAKEHMQPQETSVTNTAVSHEWYRKDYRTMSLCKCMHV